MGQEEKWAPRCSQSKAVSPGMGVPGAPAPPPLRPVVPGSVGSSGDSLARGTSSCGGEAPLTGDGEPEVHPLRPAPESCLREHPPRHLLLCRQVSERGTASANRTPGEGQGRKQLGLSVGTWPGFRALPVLCARPWAPIPHTRCGARQGWVRALSPWWEAVSPEPVRRPCR